MNSIDLDAAHIVASAKRLRDRITERFPEAALRKTAARLVSTAELMLLDRDVK